MHYSDVVHLASGFLQLVVAWYALQLGRAIGIKRTGWLLFSGLSLLTMIHVALSFGPLYDRTEWEIKVDILYALFSVLLFVGMARMKNLFADELRRKDGKLQKFADTEAKFAELEARIAQLTKANEDWPKAYGELQQTAARLQAELAEDKKRSAEAAAAHEQALATNAQLTAANGQLSAALEQLRQEAAALQQRLAAERRARETAEKAHADLLAVPPPPEKPDVNLHAFARFNRMLANVDDSITLLADRVAQSRSAQLGRFARLMREHSRHLGQFVTRDPRGKQLPDALNQLARQLSGERSALARNVDSVKRKIEKLRGISLLPTNGKSPAWPVESVPGHALQPNAEYLLQAGQTETATAVPDADEANPDLVDETVPQAADSDDASEELIRPEA